MLNGNAFSNRNKKSEPHTWNLVKVDGKYYNLDVTWDDQENVVYTYFLRSDSFMEKSRTTENRSMFPMAESDYKFLKK